MRLRWPAVIVVYAAVCLMLLGWAAAGLETGRAWLKWTAVAVCFAGAGVTLVLGVRWWRRGLHRPNWRKEMLFSFAFAVVGAAAIVTVTEAALRPGLVRYTDRQLALQGLLARRATAVEWPFRGVRIRNSFNALGWADVERSYQEEPGTIAFVGDSFLEVSSPTNLAAATEMLLRDSGRARRVLNFSKDATGPDFYRYILYECILPLRPSDAFVFVYEGNDLLPDYRHTPYVHGRFRVTTEARRALGDAGPWAGELTRVAETFEDRDSLFAALDGLPLGASDRYLVYLASCAWSPARQRPRGGAPAVVMGLRSGMTCLRGLYWRYVCTPREARYPLWQGLYADYTTVFSTKREERLETIARFVASRYFHEDDHTECLRLLLAQSQTFQDELTECPDMITRQSIR